MDRIFILDSTSEMKALAQVMGLITIEKILLYSESIRKEFIFGYDKIFFLGKNGFELQPNNLKSYHCTGFLFPSSNNENDSKYLIKLLRIENQVVLPIGIYTNSLNSATSINNYRQAITLYPKLKDILEFVNNPPPNIIFNKKILAQNLTGDHELHNSLMYGEAINSISDLRYDKSYDKTLRDYIDKFDNFNGAVNYYRNQRKK